MLTSATPTVNLVLPTSWNKATVPQLELLASLFMQEAAVNPNAINMLEIKTQLFLQCNNLEILPSNTPTEGEHAHYLVRHRRAPLFTHNEPFPLYVWQLQSIIHTHLAWLDTPSNRLQFPYPYLRKWHLSSPFTRLFQGPAPLMQNFSWNQYRMAGEYLSLYQMQQDTLVRMVKKGEPARQIRRQQHQVTTAKALFLATIFNAKIITTDPVTKRRERNFAYSPNQSTTRARYFRSFPDHKFQVILFWWIGMMHYLQKQYPKVFKTTPTKKNQVVNPLTLYTRSTATMEKYTGSDEETLNRKTYTIMLQHLHDMMEENERIKQINKK